MEPSASCWDVALKPKRHKPPQNDIKSFSLTIYNVKFYIAEGWQSNPLNTRYLMRGTPVA
jgi:hypothetical protein